VAEDGHVVETAQDMASKLTERSLHAFGVCKVLMTDAFHTALETQLQKERVAISMSVAHRDGQEGILAFVERRKPIFSPDT
jgi:2-(1,2-epoxy-1,2-dihydrophenyl)acetyl-CoA isomerase